MRMERWKKDIIELTVFSALLATWVIGGYILTKFDGDMIAFFGLFEAYGWEVGLHYFYLLAFLTTWSLLGLAVVIIIKLYIMLREKGKSIVISQQDQYEEEAQEII